MALREIVIAFDKQLVSRFFEVASLILEDLFEERGVDNLFTIFNSLGFRGSILL